MRHQPSRMTRCHRQHREPRMKAGSVRKKRGETALDRSERVAQTRGRATQTTSATDRQGRGPGSGAMRHARRGAYRAARQDRLAASPHRVARGAGPPLDPLPQSAAHAQRPIQSFVNQPKHLRLVRHREARVKVGFEWELPEQRETERVDGADGDVAEAVAQLAPSRLVDLARGSGALEVVEDALTHLGRSLAGEGNRENVALDRHTPSADSYSGPPARASCRCRQTPRARRSATDPRPPRDRRHRADPRPQVRPGPQTAVVVATSSTAAT